MPQDECDGSRYFSVGLLRLSAKGHSYNLY